jgi:hypothetical protein
MIGGVTYRLMKGNLSGNPFRNFECIIGGGLAW